MKKFAVAFAVTSMFLVVLPAVADNTADPVVVTATRTAQTADESLAAVTVITRERIEASQAQDVAELLRFEAGLDIGRAGGPGQQTSVFVRGTDSNHVVVLVDGVRINPGTIGAPAWQNIDPQLIERIEIVRGPRSTLYGSDAIGGVVQIFTRRAADGTSVTARAGSGSFNTQEGMLGVHQQANGWRGGVDVSRVYSQGYPAQVGGTQDSGFGNTSVNAYGGVKSGALDTELSVWQARGRTDYYDFLLTPLSQNFVNSKEALALKAAPTSVWSSNLRVADAADHIDQNQSNDFAHTDRGTIDWQNDLQLGQNDVLTLGAYNASEHTKAASFGTVFNEHTDTHALYAQNQWKSDNNSLLAAWRTTHHEAFGTHHTGELAYGYRFNASLRGYASYATGFRAPDSTDRFGYGGNPNLLPETSRNAEVGLRARLSTAQQANIQVFQNRIGNLINYVDPDGWLGPLPGMNQNVDEARIRGVEAGYHVVDGAWRLDASGISQNPENLATGRQLARRAANTLTIGGAYMTHDNGVGLNMLATSSRWDSDYAVTRMPGYGLVGLFAQHRLAPVWQLRARVENLFNQPYRLAEGYQTAGRALYVQLEYGRTYLPATESHP